MQSMTGSVRLKSIWDGVKKGLLTCVLCWLFGFFFMFVPIANWTIPGVFWMFGPILGLAVFVKDRRMINSLDAQAECPQCKTLFKIHEHDVAPPIYGHCPNCKTGYQLHVPRLEPAPSTNPIKDPRDKRYVPTDSAIAMKALQGRGAFFEDEESSSGDALGSAPSRKARDVVGEAQDRSDQ